MKIHAAALWLATLIATPAMFGQDADAKLDAFFRRYLDEHFRQRPLDATQLGDHRFDHLLEDVSKPSRQRWLAHARATLKELPQIVGRSRLSLGAVWS